jgi:Uma2 family endonuclease
MTLPNTEKVSITTFLDWVMGQDGRHELVDGTVYMMAGAKQGHNVIASNMQTALVPAGKRKGCRTTSSDTAVQTGPNSIRFPDVVVDCGPADASALTAVQPTIVVEVSSPGTIVIDETAKLEEYRRLNGLAMILQIESEVVLVRAHRRSDDGMWTTQTYETLSDVVEIEPLGTSLTLAEVYDTLSVYPRPRLQVVRESESG